jgi:3-hydroxyisobutyrate dehydrogenase-like beta-hydroxyacid dehydrogenase
MRVAFLGLGIMGSRQAANLARNGFELTVWNRTASVAEQFGGEHPHVSVAASPLAAAADADVVFTMVVDGEQVESLLLGDSGAAHGARPGTLFVDCSTIGVAAAMRIGERLDGLEMQFLDAPVTGSSPAAQDGTLTFMVGGRASDFERARPVLEAMGRLLVHVGPRGHGQLVKVINNAVAATNANTLGQALIVASRAGADLDALIRVLAAGAAGSTMVNLKARPMVAHDYTTLFKLDHMLKDVRFCLEEAADAGATFEFAQRTEQVLAAASAMGFGQVDFAALIEALETDAGSSL